MSGLKQILVGHRLLGWLDDMTVGMRADNVMDLMDDLVERGVMCVVDDVAVGMLDDNVIDSMDGPS